MCCAFRGPRHSGKRRSIRERLKQPFGIAFYPLGRIRNGLHRHSDGVVRFRYKNGDLGATGKPERIIEGIPWVHHYARDIVFSPDGSRLFLSVGSG